MNTPLLATDQTICYDTHGKAIDCSHTGQDAAQDKMILPPEQRFIPQGDLVLDTVTKALWTKDANPFCFPMEWAKAHKTVKDMAERQAYGQCKWQLPSRRLLFSLISHQEHTPALIAGNPFSDVFSGYYWTDDACHRLPDQAWHIHIGGGRVTKGNKADAALVWPVCPSVANGEPALGPDGEDRFLLAGPVAQDRNTGLFWSLDAGSGPSPVSWQEALDHIDRLNASALHGRKTWRLPNIRELESLVSLEADSPALPQGHPFTNVREGYWSSTTSVYEPRYAWVLYMRDGMVGVGYKPDRSFYLWPVCDR